MASATVPSIYRKLRDISISYQVHYCLPLVAINNNEYCIIVLTDMKNESMKMMKYSSTRDEWQEFLSEFNVSHHGAYRCHASNGRLFMVQHENLRSIDLNTGSNTFRRLSLDFTSQCIISLNDQVHLFGSVESDFSSSPYHCLIDTITGSVTMQEMDGIQGDCFSSPIYQKSRDRIIFCSTHEEQYMFMEYSLQTQRYGPLNWSRLKSAIVRGGFVSSLDERFVVGFGGDNLRNTLDQIIVFDFKTQTVFESEIKCPIQSWYHAVTLGSKEQDELTLFGFINQSYKDQSLRNVQSLPIHVIQMMCKWYCNERVSLLAYGLDDCTGHWSVNLDEIIRYASMV